MNGRHTEPCVSVTPISGAQCELAHSCKYSPRAPVCWESFWAQHSVPPDTYSKERDHPRLLEHEVMGQWERWSAGPPSQAGPQPRAPVILLPGRGGPLTVFWLIPVVGVQLLIDLLFLRFDHGRVALGQLAEERRRLAGVAWRFGAHPAVRIRHPRLVHLGLFVHP